MSIKIKALVIIGKVIGTEIHFNLFRNISDKKLDKTKAEIFVEYSRLVKFPSQIEKNYTSRVYQIKYLILLK